jgi:glycosyltransferase involved in cell wall biosynthesis
MYEECTRLAEKGHNIHLLTREELIRHGYDEVKNILEWKYPVNNNNSLLFLKTTISNSRRLFETLSKRFEYQVLNCHQPFSAAGVLSSRAVHGIPLIYTCLSFSFEEYASRTLSPMNAREWLSLQFQLLGRKLVEKWVLKKSRHIVVLSDFTREKLSEVYGIEEKKISIIPGGVDLTRFAPPENKALIRHRLGFSQDKTILFTVRNLVPRMGLENLISAYEIVLNERSDLLLVIGGTGPLGPSLKKQAEESGVNDFIRFVGFVSEEELPSYYQMADLFILPTKELEGFGLVTVEALASGLPVLGTPVGGTREILAHLGPEFLFADSTPATMADLILKTMNAWGEDPKTYQDISQKCRGIAERYYSWESHIASLERLFQKIGLQYRESST